MQRVSARQLGAIFTTVRVPNIPLLASWSIPKGATSVFFRLSKERLHDIYKQTIWYFVTQKEHTIHILFTVLFSDDLKCAASSGQCTQHIIRYDQSDHHMNTSFVYHSTTRRSYGNWPASMQALSFRYVQAIWMDLQNIIQLRFHYVCTHDIHRLFTIKLTVKNKAGVISWRPWM